MLSFKYKSQKDNMFVELMLRKSDAKNVLDEFIPIIKSKAFFSIYNLTNKYIFFRNVIRIELLKLQ
jgi:hypothetical protein